MKKVLRRAGCPALGVRENGRQSSGPNANTCAPAGDPIGKTAGPVLDFIGYV